MLMKPPSCLVLAALLWAGQPRFAFGQTPEERAGARAAADQGYDAFQRNDWANALDLFGRAESLVHSPVHVLYLARSDARLGRLIEAQEAYLSIVHEALPTGAAAAVKQAQQDAARELAALEPRIPFVRIEVESAGSADPLEVTQDGRALPPALVGVAHPLNPGEHTWRARSGSRQSPPETRSVQPGSKIELLLKLPEADIELSSPRAAAPAPLAAGPTTAVPPTAVAPATPSLAAAPAPAAAAAKPAHGGGPSPWVYVGLGMAGAGAGVGTVYLLHKSNIEDRIRRTCTPDCLATSDNLKRKSEADRAGVISAIGFTVGGVSLASALALWLLEPDAAADSNADAADQRLQLWLGYNGASVTGSF
jgi:hypothetical protein